MIPARNSSIVEKEHDRSHPAKAATAGNLGRSVMLSRKQVGPEDGLPSAEQGSKPLSEKEIDFALVQRVQRGDKKAFDLLVLKYQTKIVHLVSRYVHDAHESQDVTQEAFIKAYRGLKNFRGDSAFYTWLYRIAINTAKNHLVTMNRKITDTGIDAADAEQYDAGGALREYATPDREMITEQIAQSVQDSIAALPEDLRMAITLREFDGMSYEDIANAMDCPIGTVRSRIFRARETIDTNLEPLLDEKRR